MIHPRTSAQAIVLAGWLAAFGVASSPALGATSDTDGPSATITASSEYDHNGLLQSAGEPSVQMSADYTLHGFYLGVAAATVNFDTAWLEAEYDAGFNSKIGSITYDAGYAYYTYPGSNPSFGYHYGEYGLTLSQDFGPAKLTVLGTYAPKYPNVLLVPSKQTYVGGTLDVPLSETFALTGHVGRTWADKLLTDFGPYSDWSFGFHRDYGSALSISARYIKNTANHRYCLAQGLQICAPHAVLSITRTF